MVESKKLDDPRGLLDLRRLQYYAWLVPIGLPFLYGALFQSMPAVFFLTIFMIFFLPVALIYLVVIAVKNTPERRERRMIAMALAAIYLMAQPLVPALLWQPLYTAGLWAGILPFYGYYKAQVAALPRDEGPRLLVIDLGSAAFWGHALIYDESDRVSLPSMAGEPGIRADADQSWPCNGRSIRLARHYYACAYDLTI